MAHERSVNDSLTRHIDESRAREDDANLTAQLADAEDEIVRLRDQLRHTDKQLQVSSCSKNLKTSQLLSKFNDLLRAFSTRMTSTDRFWTQRWTNAPT